MENKQEKKKGAFGRFMKAVFVNNIGYKIFAIIFGALVWAMFVGLA